MNWLFKWKRNTKNSADNSTTLRLRELTVGRNANWRVRD